MALDDVYAPDTIAKRELIPAATVIVVRDGDDGRLEALMVRRSHTASAFGGRWVFPGGQVDPEDTGDDPIDSIEAARRAAVREAAEETGLSLEPHTLVPLSYWVPPPETPRRFGTWFLLAPGAMAHEVNVDGTEIHEHAWIAPRDAIDRHAAGEMELVPPTWVTLARLSEHATTADALAAAVAEPTPRFATHVGQGAPAGALVLLWEGDAGYDSCSVAAEGPRHRITVAGTEWAYERSP